jgi:hypothetical protein
VNILNYVLSENTTSRFLVKFTNANTYTSGALTLNVNSTGAKSLYINGAPSSASNYSIPAGVFPITYNGTYYNVDTDGGLTVSGQIRGSLADYLNTFFTIIRTNEVTQSIGANTGLGVSFTGTIPDGYMAVTTCGIDTTGPAGAVNCYSDHPADIIGKTGSFTQKAFFRNYTSSTVSVTMSLFILCQKIY